MSETLQSFIGISIFIIVVYLAIGFILQRRAEKKSPSRYSMPKKERIVYILTWPKHLFGKGG